LLRNPQTNAPVLRVGVSSSIASVLLAVRSVDPSVDALAALIVRIKLKPLRLLKRRSLRETLRPLPKRRSKMFTVRVVPVRNPVAGRATVSASNWVCSAQTSASVMGARIARARTTTNN